MARRRSSGVIAGRRASSLARWSWSRLLRPSGFCCVSGSARPCDKLALDGRAGRALSLQAAPLSSCSCWAFCSCERERVARLYLGGYRFCRACSRKRASPRRCSLRLSLPTRAGRQDVSRPGRVDAPVRQRSPDLFFSMPWPIAVASFLLATVISSPLAYLFELGGNTIWAPALLHFVIQATVKVMVFRTEPNRSRSHGSRRVRSSRCWSSLSKPGGPGSRVSHAVPTRASTFSLASATATSPEDTT